MLSINCTKGDTNTYDEVFSTLRMHTHTVRSDRYVPNARVLRTKSSVISELKYAQCHVTRYVLSARVHRTKCLVRSGYVSTVQSSRTVLNPCIHKTKGSECSIRKYPQDKVFSKFRINYPKNKASVHSGAHIHTTKCSVRSMHIATLHHNLKAQNSYMWHCIFN